MRSNHSTRAKVWGKAKAAHRDSGLQLERVQAKAKTKSGTHPNLIARAQALAKVKAEKDPELEREPAKVKTKSGTQLSVIFKEQEQVREGQATLEQTGTRPERRITETEPGPKIMGTETLGETKATPTPAKWPGPEVVPLTSPVR